MSAATAGLIQTRQADKLKQTERGRSEAEQSNWQFLGLKAVHRLLAQHEHMFRTAQWTSASEAASILGADGRAEPTVIRS